MPSKETKSLEINQYQKSDKSPLVIYADPECLLERIDGCTSNPENSSTTKVSEHILTELNIFNILAYQK